MTEKQRSNLTKLRDMIANAKTASDATGITAFVRELVTSHEKEFSSVDASALADAELAAMAFAQRLAQGRGPDEDLRRVALTKIDVLS